MSEKKSGGQIIWESLMHEGVDVVFGITGGAILPTYDDLSKYNYPIHAITTTHEQGAAHMADGYARATGKVGVTMVTSGPGATNLITGLATAHMDSTPIVAITGQVPTSLLGRDGFQESDVFGISMPVTKHNYLITDIKELPMALKEAFHIAQTGRPGPVLVDICKDVQQNSMPFDYPTEVNLPGYHPNMTVPDSESVARAAKLLNEAIRPVIVAGQGVSIAKAEKELRQLAEIANIPVATSLLGIGCFPSTHPLSISWGGMHGESYTNYAMQECDVMFAIGARLDDRLTGAFATFAPKARIIHVDLDPAEMGKNLTIDTPVVGDALLTLRDLLPQIQPNEHPAWLAQIAEWKAESSERDILSQEIDDLIAPYIMRELWHATNEGDCTVVSDVGQHQMWEAQYFPHTKRRSLLTSGGLGTMGYALPAAIGAQIGKPDEEIWVVAGDGGFQMTMPELSTVMQENLPIKMALINNGYLGMVRQWQDIFYNKRYSGTPLYNPDFVKIAEAYGIPARSITRKEDVTDVIKEAQAYDGPYLIDFQVDELTNVFPMVAAGGSNVDMIRRPLPTTEVDE
ncbi:MAG: biosynthetic-type acetolactate synthase large subunit [Candidatus Promineifilaceae bacterium]|nr:biosynthetic-type acetolactate synthase large subunit [Candidatus Promineifilaceae bacterium]